MNFKSLSATVVGLALLAAPAATRVLAQQNDGFTAKTSNGCGSVEFVDYGPGVPGGRDNDDYTLVRDLCGDGHGIRAYVNLTRYVSTWRNEFNYTEYSGKGNGSSLVWDPFKPIGNVKPNDVLRMKVCLVDGEGDVTPFSCGQWEQRASVDG